MSEWQPIETAPKDGTQIDLWVDDERVADAYWGTERVPFEDREVTGWCAPHRGVDGQPAPLVDPEDKEYPDPEPSHWMPLPEPPSG